MISTSSTPKTGRKSMSDGATTEQNEREVPPSTVTAVDSRFQSGDLKTVDASSDKVNRDGESHQTRLANDMETSKSQ